MNAAQNPLLKDQLGASTTSNAANYPYTATPATPSSSSELQLPKNALSKKRPRPLKTKRSQDISPLFALPQYDASNLLGFPRSTFCRKWKQATTTSEASAASAPSDFYEGPKPKKNKRQSLGKPQTVYRRWPFRRLKMIDERINALIFNEGEPVNASSIDSLVELFTEKILLSEPVFFEIDSSLSNYVAPVPIYPKQILESVKNDEPLDIIGSILTLISKLPQDAISAFPVPYQDSAQSTHQISLDSICGSRPALFDTGLHSSLTMPSSSSSGMQSLPHQAMTDSFFASLLSSIEP